MLESKLFKLSLKSQSDDLATSRLLAPRAAGKNPKRPGKKGAKGKAKAKSKATAVSAGSLASSAAN
eukprot:14494643-Alexandrium_andersonii.AAC.1